jgi:hypothetical protein
MKEKPGDKAGRRRGNEISRFKIGKGVARFGSPVG